MHVLDRHLVEARVLDRGAGLRYRWTVSKREARLVLERLAPDGTAAEIASKPISYRPGQWYRMAAARRGDRVQCYLDGALVLEGDAGVSPLGQAGLYVAGGPVYFDDVEVATEALFCLEVSG